MKNKETEAHTKNLKDRKIKPWNKQTFWSKQSRIPWKPKIWSNKKDLEKTQNKKHCCRSLGFGRRFEESLIFFYFLLFLFFCSMCWKFPSFFLTCFIFLDFSFFVQFFLVCQVFFAFCFIFCFLCFLLFKFLFSVSFFFGFFTIFFGFLFQFLAFLGLFVFQVDI